MRQSPFAYGHVIRSCRSLLNWSQQELAERAGVPRGPILRAEHGQLLTDPAVIKPIGEAFAAAGLVVVGSKDGVAIVVPWDVVETPLRPRTFAIVEKD